MQTVAVLICTCDRPRQLQILLAALVREVVSVENCKVLAVVVVDNGKTKVSEITDQFCSELPIVYECLPEPSLVRARNRSLECGLSHHPEFLVFIDDDEEPAPGWLSGLLSCMAGSGADFAIGPVKPEFETDPPMWAEEFFTKSGNDYCTSNLIIRSKVIPNDKLQWFQMKFNSTGGEDFDFLSRLATKGAKQALAKTALVFESIPAARLTNSYRWRSSFRDGIVASQIGKTDSPRRRSTFLETLPTASKKILLSLNHVLWSAKDPARIYRAADDFLFGLGLVCGSIGIKTKFY